MTVLSMITKELWIESEGELWDDSRVMETVLVWSQIVLGLVSNNLELLLSES